jgi:hypothetical protein
MTLGHETAGKAFTGIFDEPCYRLGAKPICEIPARHEHQFRDPQPN